jgi:hypothetical protein
LYDWGTQVNVTPSNPVVAVAGSLDRPGVTRVHPRSIEEQDQLVPVSHTIRAWTFWLEARVVEHAVGVDVDGDDGLMVRARSVASGGEMILRYIRSALGQGEDVSLDNLPGRDDEKNVSNFTLWSLFDDDKACWNMYVSSDVSPYKSFTHSLLMPAVKLSVLEPNVQLLDG